MNFEDTKDRIPYDKEVIAWVQGTLKDKPLIQKISIELERVEEWRCSHDYSYDVVHVIEQFNSEIPIGAHSSFNRMIFSTKEAARNNYIQQSENKIIQLTEQIEYYKKRIETLKEE